MTEFETTLKRRNFSLGKLLVSVLLFSAGGSLLYLRGENDRLRLDNFRLATELGKLYINDPTKIHVLLPEVPLKPYGTWRWRIYLPPGRKYTACMQIQDIPADGISPANSYLSLPTGEFVFEARLQEEQKGEWTLVISTETQAHGNGIPEALVPNFLKLRRQGRENCAGVGEVAVSDPLKPVVLLRDRENFIDTDRNRKNSVYFPNPCAGFLIWIAVEPSP